MRTHIQKPFNPVNDHAQQADVMLQAAILATTTELYNNKPSDESLAWLKADCLELVTLIEKVAKNPLQSRFNVINRSKQVIAKSIPFAKAKRIQDKLTDPCYIKFSGMELVS